MILPRQQRAETVTRNGCKPPPAPGDLARRRGRLPLGWKIGFSLFMLAWVPVVLASRGWQNLLWLCDFGNFLVLVGLWRESRLLLSSQLVATLVVGIAWGLDLAGGLLLGIHPFQATVYMFEPALPLALRLSSLFHLAVPVLLFLALRRLGHDARGWRLQTAICWLVLPAGFWLTDPERNINWVFAPFGIPQSWLPGEVYLALCMLAYPLLLYLPAELALRRLLPRADTSRGRRLY